MFKRRAQLVVEDAASAVCRMCGCAVVVDADGRCALGHVVAAAPAPMPAAPAVDTEPRPVTEAAAPAADAVAEMTAQPETASADKTAPARPSVPPASQLGAGDDLDVIDDLLGFDAPATTSSLDIDTETLPLAAAPEPAAPAVQTLPDPADLLDELDDTAYVRRRAAGIAGGSALGAIALLGALQLAI